MTLYITKKRHAKIIKEVEELIKKYPDRTAWSIYQQVADRHSYSTLTIRNICNASQIEEADPEGPAHE